MKKAQAFAVAFGLLSVFGSAIGQDLSGEQLRRNKIIQQVQELAPEGGVCGGEKYLAGEKEFACGLFELSAAATKRFVESGWRLEKISVYLTPGMKGLGAAPQSLKDLRVANPGTLVEVQECENPVFCEKVTWTVILVPPSN